ncbi:MAG: hypothetical protein EP343_20475 [Deltaproteobacteria bacterium]|nr:MAG: hypothetical protein EP343_20475 [Deltaproteobacteria bacterium]
MSHPNPKDEFQRRFGSQGSPQSPGVGPKRSLRSSLQRSIGSSGQGTKLKTQEFEDNSQAPTTEKSQQSEASQVPEAPSETRRVNLYNKLPPKVQEKIPVSVRSMLDWPHPGDVWHRATGPHTAWRQRLGSLSSWRDAARQRSKQIWEATSNKAKLTGSAIGTWTYKWFDRTMQSLKQTREKLPGLDKVKSKIPGAEKISSWMESSLEKMSQATDRKILQQAIQQLQLRGVAEAGQLDIEHRGHTFAKEFLARDSFGDQLRQSPDFVPVVLHNHPEKMSALFAFKQWIPESYPELVEEGVERQLRLIGFVLTYQHSQANGKTVDLSCVQFANMVAGSMANLQANKDFVQSVRMKWRLFDAEVSNRVNQAALNALGQGLIGKDTYQAINLAARSLLPEVAPQE